MIILGIILGQSPVSVIVNRWMSLVLQFSDFVLGTPNILLKLSDVVLDVSGIQLEVTNLCLDRLEAIINVGLRLCDGFVQRIDKRECVYVFLLYLNSLLANV